jgi:hypothetical protein
MTEDGLSVKLEMENGLKDIRKERDGKIQAHQLLLRVCACENEC